MNTQCLLNAIVFICSFSYRPTTDVSVIFDVAARRLRRDFDAARMSLTGCRAVVDVVVAVFRSQCPADDGIR